MKRRGPRAELTTLKRFIAEVEGQFLAPHLASSALAPPTRREVLDVAAYVVLTHGALENFIEGLGLWALERVERSWLYNKRATRATASILLYLSAPKEDTAPGKSVFDNLRLALQDAKSEAAVRIEKNNGVAPLNLRALFRPLGIDVPEDPILSASLDSLVSLRHQWAHQYRFGARVLKSARDVKRTVQDCVVLAEQLSSEAATARP